MKSYSSREIVKIITKYGWYEVNCVGDHHQYKDPTKKGRLTIVGLSLFNLGTYT